VEELSRLPQLNSVIIPDNLNDEEVRNSLLANYNIDIGAGLGALAGKIWRIGLMGYTSRKENIENLLSAMKETL
jgi:alanine-glyoxylate transaminase/serine-glyoxylate transaminase/serine-pyruvate transaminase